jgi:hypothetical protein
MIQTYHNHGTKILAIALEELRGRTDLYCTMVRHSTSVTKIAFVLLLDIGIAGLLFELYQSFGFVTPSALFA